jgi:hypothetical protein
LDFLKLTAPIQNSIMARLPSFFLIWLFYIGVCSALWGGFVGPNLYNCTDDGPFMYKLGFTFPGNWTHHPVEVEHIVVDMNMNHPDTIKTGWSITGLWVLWSAMFSLSVVLSWITVYTLWNPKPNDLAESSFGDSSIEHE